MRVAAPTPEFLPTRSRSTSVRSSGCTGPIRSACVARFGAWCCTRWRITSASATSVWSSSTATSLPGNCSRSVAVAGDEGLDERQHVLVRLVSGLLANPREHGCLVGPAALGRECSDGRLRVANLDRERFEVCPRYHGLAVSLDVELGAEAADRFMKREHELGRQAPVRRGVEAVAEEEHSVGLDVHHARVRCVVAADVPYADRRAAE